MSLAELKKKVLGELAPPPPLSIDQWADIYRRVSAEASPEAGRWRTDKVPYLRGILAAIKDPSCREVAWMAASQVAKTEAILNTIGYHVHIDPCPILYMLPNGDLIDAVSKDRLAPMIRDTPVLKDRIVDPKSRDSSNTIKHKIFPGGSITFVTAASAPAVSARPIRIVIADESDRIGSAGKEGSGDKLGKRRSSNFWNRKFISFSSPTRLATSKVYQAYTTGKRHKFGVPCASCEEVIFLEHEQLVWQENRPETARYRCQVCETLLKDGHIKKMVRRGEWVCLDPDMNNYRMSFQISALYSRWVSLQDYVQEYVDSRAMVEDRIVFRNTYEGLPYEENLDGVEDLDLYMRREQYGATVPRGGLCVCASVDLQGDRGEVQTIAYGHDWEAWAVEHRVIRVDPQLDEFWRQLDHFLRRTYTHELGHEVPISCTLIDSGDGKITNRVYDFCADKEHRRIYPSKGRAGEDRAIAKLSKAKATSGSSCDLWILGVDEAKSLLYHRLQLAAGGPGSYHFPFVDWCSKDYFKQMTAEKCETTFVNGLPKKVWKRVGAKTPNEVLDLYVMNMAACVILNPIWEALEDYHEGLAAEAKAGEVGEETAEISSDEGASWASNWKDW